MTKIYRYHIVDANGTRIESNLPERAHAETMREFLTTQGHKDLTITQEHCPQLHGHRLGRDPDLH
jgi:hypothetical protein